MTTKWRSLARARRLLALRRKAVARARDERGVVAIIFALALVVLVPMVFGLLDVYTASEQRVKLQDALDAAALYVARSGATTDAEVSAAGEKALAANLKLIRGASLISSDFNLNDNQVVATATIQPLSLTAFWALPQVTANTEAIRSSNNLEVALVLDITGSMSGTKIDDLKDAASDLVDIVVKDVQTPYYSKLAIVPYSNSVNVGTYADAARGAPTPGKAISGATNADPAKITTVAAHGFSNNDVIYINGVLGMTQINNRAFYVKNKNASDFKLYTYPGDNEVNSNSYNAYTSAGLVNCTNTGCNAYKFTNADGNGKVFPLTTCVSERTTNPYNDVAPSTTLLGRVYAGASNGCPTATIIPLSTDRDALKEVISTLAAEGSTAGHIGLAWGWYMVSPNFGYMWPSASNRPAAYGTNQLLKVVILMTDGAFNTAYANGVIAKNSGSGSGGDEDHINLNATNGSAFSQAQSLCAAMKADDIIIYTVGFNVGSDTQAQNIMSQCATDASHVYFPSGGTALKDAFKAIGADINSLRLSH